MIKLKGFPKNKEKFMRLTDFLEEVLNACKDVDISPIIEASLAVFAYTRDQELEVNDIDMLIPEKYFPDLIRKLDQVGIKCELKAWHVLRVLKDDLKLEFDSVDYWPNQWGIVVQNEYDTLKINDLKLFIIDLPSLIRTYEVGVQQHNTFHEKYRHKLELLKSVEKSKS